LFELALQQVNTVCVPTCPANRKLQQEGAWGPKGFDLPLLNGA